MCIANLGYNKLVNIPVSDSSSGNLNGFCRQTMHINSISENESVTITQIVLLHS